MARLALQLVKALNGDLVAELEADAGWRCEEVAQAVAQRTGSAPPKKSAWIDPGAIEPLCHPKPGTGAEKRKQQLGYLGVVFFRVDI